MIIYPNVIREEFEHEKDFTPFSQESIQHIIKWLWDNRSYILDEEE